MITKTIYSSLFYFLLAGVCEIGGGYLIWKAVKGIQPFWFGILGCLILALYGLLATFQTAGFGRTYAVYGGLFVIMALLWGWVIDKVKPDLYDLIGATIILIGTIIIFYAPHKQDINNN